MMYFRFSSGVTQTEALVTGMTFDKEGEQYKLALLGIGDDRISYSVPGTAWFDAEDFDELVESDALEFPHDLVGRKLIIISATEAKKGKGDSDEEEF